MARVLIVDDEKSIRSTVGEFLRMDGHEVWTAGDAGAARAILEAHAVDVVVTDIILPRVSGVTLLQQIKERDPGVQVIMMTGEPTVDTAVEAVRAGACDYLPKPIGKRDLLAVVRNAAHVKALLDETRRLEAENRLYEDHLEEMVTERTATLTERTRQLAAVREVAAEISREMHLANALDLIVQRAMGLVSGLSATVFIWDEPRQCLIPRAWRGYREWRGTVELKTGEGVAGTVVANRQRLVVEDYGSSPYALPFILAHASETGPVLAEPLLHGDAMLGVLVVDRPAGARRFDKDDQDILALFAHHAAIAIQNAWFFGEAEERRAEAEVLAELAQAVSASLDPDTVLQRVAEGAKTLCRCDLTQIALRDEDAGLYRMRFWAGAASEAQTQMCFAPGQGMGGQVVETRKPARTDDYVADPPIDRTFAGLAQTEGVVALLAVPIAIDDRVHGVLFAINRSPRPFTDRNEVMLQRLADHAALAIRNAGLYQQIREHAVDLEARVEARTQDLARANEQLQTASRHKSEFLANMSHEIRTPLNSILGFAQVLQEQGKGVLTEKQRRFLDNIYRSGQHLLRLINDILDLSKVEAGKFVLNPEPLPVAQTVEDILVIARGLAHRKGQRIDAEIAPDLPRVLADSVRFKQICFNLLSNAVKYTPEGGEIAVKVRAVSRGDPGAGETDAGGAGAGPDGYLELAVTDTGVGIRADDIPLLFREFTQLETTRAQHQEGTGLGLALTKRLVELHGGRIWAESAGEGRGATFTVRLPFAGPGTTQA